MRANKIRTATLGSILLFCSLFASNAVAQNIQFTQGSVGSGQDNTIQIPIVAYPGRGGSSLPVTLYYSSRVWRIGHLNTFYNPTWHKYQSVSEAIYAEFSTAGWKTSLDLPVIEWPKNEDAYYPGGGAYCFPCSPNGSPFRVARVYIHMPDGSRHELRKSDQPYQGGIDMYGTFYDVDGSRLRYESTGQTTGTLYLPDGTRYILDGSTAQFIDRNGNTLNYSNGQWTDTLGRTVGIPIPANPSAQDYSYLPPGLSQPYIFRFKELKDTLTSIPNTNPEQFPTRKPIGNDYLPNPGALPTAPGGGNYPVTIQSAWSEPPSLFITDFAGDEDPPTVVVGRGQSGGALFNPVVLAEIILPNGLSYKFTYNIYGEIDKVVYPTGGFERYEYDKVPGIGSITEPYTQANRGIIKRQVNANGTGNDLATWTYESTGTIVTTSAPDLTVTKVYKHNFTAPPRGRNGAVYWPFGFEDARNGMVYDTRISTPESQGGTVLRRTLTEWEQTENNVPPRSSAPGEATEKAYRNPRPKKEVSLILDTGGNALAKTITYSYDTQYQLTTGLDLTASTETYFSEVDQATAQTGGISLTESSAAITIAQGLTARVIETSYQNGLAYRERNILGLVTSSVIKDAGLNIVAKTETVYDEFSSHPLLTYSDLGTDYTNPGTTARGLATTIRHYVDIGAGQWLETHAQYDQCGSPRVLTNERGLETLTDYSSTYKHAYPTQVTTTAPDPSGQHASNTGFTSGSTYDLTTGLLLTSTGVNGRITTYKYKDEQNNPDPLNRLRKVERPDGGWTKYTYNEVDEDGDQKKDFYTLTETKQDDTHTIKTYQYLDALGRASHVFMSEGMVNNVESYIASDVKYDKSGRTCAASNPYRTQTRNGAVAGDCTWAANWTTTVYDALSRRKQVTLPDGTSVQTDYAGVYATVTDQAGKQRRLKTDALGRIVRVDEPDLNGSLGTTDSPNQATSYEYDTLSNLIHIQQGAGSYIQHRYFKYDSLSRLTYERQVEQAPTFTSADSLTGNSQWSRKIVYDENGYSGLVTSQYDARNIRAQYAYDNLNRIVGISYNDSVTPSVSYFYDLTRFTNSQDTRTIYNLGRMTEVQTASLGSLPQTTQAYNYDLMGRVANNRQTVGTNSYSMIYQYNLGGALKSEQYPSGRAVTFDYGEAGRLQSVVSGGTTYASQFKYDDPRGLLSSFLLGSASNQVKESYTYNSRLQFQSLELAKGSDVLQRYEYKYGKVNTDGTVDETKNNGQIGRIESWIGTAKQWQQRFDYDSLGRLSQASEYRGDNAQLSYLMTYEYDVFGNRYQNAAQNTQNTLPYVAVEDSHINKQTNRFTVGITDNDYDASGNILRDPKFTGRQYLYDANNRQRQVASLDGTNAVTSIYDGTGQRVATMTASAVDSVFVYDAGGKLVAEYGQTIVNRGTSYVFTDHQSSTRAVLDSMGNLTSRHDYQPFGAELGAGLGLRTTNQFYGQSDSARQKYAGMETDDVSNSSHTLWRKYDAQSGRWTSPDPYSGSMTVADPQSFNRYTYVNNDPVNQSDPLGLMAGADQGWGNFEGFGGSSLGFTDSHFGGPQIINDSMTRHDSLVQARTDGILAQSYLAKGNTDAAQRIFNSNSDVGLYVNGGALWGEDAANYVSFNVTVSAVVNQFGVSATVYFWAPYSNGVGHLAVGFSNGIYISFWPKRSPGPLGVKIWGGEEDALLQDGLKTDIRSEDGRQPTESFTLDNLDGVAVKSFYDNLRQNPGKWSIGRNCADIVAGALQSAGLGIKNTQPGSSTPRDVFNIIKAAADKPRICMPVDWQGKDSPQRMPK
jgi:RHS repeat-associated protein